MSAEAVGRYIEEDDAIEAVHVEQAQEGQSAALMDVNSHFVCFTNVDGNLYELDGRKSTPINHVRTHTSHTLCNFLW